MPDRTLLTTGWLLAAALLAGSAPLAALEPPSAEEKWVAVDVQELRIVSDGNARLVRGIARSTLLMREALGRTTRLVVTSPLPTTVLAFENRRDFRRYAAAAIGPEGRVSGFFQGHPDGNYVLLDGSNLADSNRVLFHELTHFFVNNSLPSSDLPLWVSEGLAELYSTFEVRGERVEIGRPVPGHVWTLRERLLPLAEVLATTHESLPRREEARVHLFYAQSWALVHYLLIGAPERAGQLAGYLNAVGAGREPADAFGTAFGVAPDEFERELTTYLRRRSFPFHTITLADLGEPSMPEPERLGYGTVLVRLAEVLAHTDGGTAAARAFLDRALALGPDPDAEALLGAMLEDGGDPAAARPLYERALAHDRLGCIGLVRAGESLLRRYLDGAGGGVEQAGARAPAHEAFSRAATRCPSLWRAHAGLGDLLLLGHQDLPTAVGAYQRAVELAPGLPHLRQRLATARKLADSSSGAGTAVTFRLSADEGRTAITRTEVRDGVDPDHQARLLNGPDRAFAAVIAEAQRLAQAEGPEAAQAFLERSAEAATDPTLKADILALAENARERRLESRRAELWNQAVEQAEAKQYEAAKATLDELLPLLDASSSYYDAATQLHGDIVRWLEWRRSTPAAPGEE